MPPFPFTPEELTPEETARIKSAMPHWPLNDYVRYPASDLLITRPYVELADKIYNMEVREDDIWLVTWPKVGSTWTQETVWQIVNNVDKVGGQMPQLVRVPWVEFGAILPKESLGKLPPPPEGTPKEILEAMGAFFGEPIEYTVNKEGRRVIKTHLPLEFLPPSLLEKGKVVYVARNIKDAVVSYFHHNVNLAHHDYQGTFEEFAQFCKEGLVCYGSYWPHVKGAWNHKDHPNVHFLWYEDMKKDQKQTIENLCTFLGCQLSEEKVTELVDHLKFDNMKKNMSLNLENLLKEGTEGFIRKGKVGDWKNHFDEKLKKEWNDWIKENLKGTTIPKEYFNID